MSLHNNIKKGLSWNAASKLTGQIIAWGITLIVIRLLNPDDYGLMAMATVVLSVVALIGEMGMGVAIIQTSKLDQLLVRQIFGASLVFSISVTMVITVLSPFIAYLFSEQRLTLIIQALSIQLLISAFAVVPDSLLRRDMCFRKLAVIDTVVQISSSISTIILAYCGYGVWALVFGSIAGQLVRVILLYTSTKYRYWPSFKFSGFRSSALFGGQITLSRIIWLVYSQADVIIVGRFFGKEALGFYSVSIHLASMPMNKIMSVVNQVAFPAVSLVQHQTDVWNVGIKRGIRVIAIGVFPALWGMAIVAPELIDVALGANWSPAIIPFQLVAIAIPLRMLLAFFSTTICALGRSDLDLYCTVVGFVVLLISFVIGAQWGLVGLAASWVFAVPIIFLIVMLLIGRTLKIRFLGLMKMLLNPVVAAFLMVVSVSMCRYLIMEFSTPLVRLPLLVVVGSLVYVMSLICLEPKILKELRGSFGPIEPSRPQVSTTSSK